MMARAKKTFSGILVLGFICMGLQACGEKSQQQADCGFVQNVYGERISWKDSPLVPLYVDPQFPSELLPALDRAIAVWEQAAGRPLFKVMGSLSKANEKPAQDGINGVYWLSEWEANRTDEQARTSVYWVVDQIKEADVRVNAKDFSYFLDEPTASNQIHLESLLVHELGHALGLRHQDANASVMATRLSSSTVRIALSDSDRQAIQCEYQ